MSSRGNRASQPWVVLKFGGTSVSSRRSWEAIASIVEARLSEGKRPLVVCSAASGVSDGLERLLEASLAGSPEEALERIAARHSALAAELGVDYGEIEPFIGDLGRLVTGAAMIREVSPRLRAGVMAQGELILTRLGAAFLRGRGIGAGWCDARDCLTSVRRPGASAERLYLQAGCDAERDPVLSERLSGLSSLALITQGFIARDASGDTVLLGRGGSDTSAAYFAAKLGARRCEIWTDVPGMFTANPRLVPDAHLIKSLDYDEAQEIASSGAKVLHPRCLGPVRRHGIPLSIHCLAYPGMQGTVVSPEAVKAGAQVKAISSRSGITLISMETVDMWQQVGFLADAFDCFKRHNISIDLVSTSETNVTVTVDKAQNAMDAAAVPSLLADLGRICQARCVESCAAVSLVGKDIRAILHKIAPALEVFEEQKIFLVSQAANDLNVTFVVNEEQAPRLVRELHGELFGQRKKSSILGPTWDEITGAAGERGARAPRAWWRDRGEELISLAAVRTPLYVYDGATVRAQIEKLKSMGSIDRIFYSMKANPHPGILREACDAGLGFECVSPGEVERALAVLKGTGPAPILFTPNFASMAEYRMALELGAIVTLDNLYPLSAWPEIFRGREIFVRIDPGKGRGHHEFVHTAGAKSKFGISPDQFDELSSLVNSSGARVTGLHAHVGSNIFKAETWSNTAIFLAEAAERFPEARALDLGGGLGVVEKPGVEPLDLGEVDSMLARAKAAHPRYELWIEPGRYIAAEAGVLLAKVTQTKTKGDYRYVGTDAGMNTLIRPALYGSYHEIVNLTRIGEPAAVTADVVGPICESGDVLGHDRRMPEPREGDVMLIGTAGAYGRVMSSSYNLRPPAEERFIEAK
ncbi:MAG: bifunctional aspartate kinase/diaminopimelate decarboxylase [Proteobacteria bacterium]|nr:bifunctional aspartate kinase/diaminopimelate decarboxylase [Pseudomonadota bacterium]